jgi:ATP/maltotriose-dependent transcriptional regulator MalT
MPIPHLAYFEKLAETEEGTDEWNATTGGLIVLRMLDTWNDFGAHALRENKRGVKNIHKAVRAIEERNPIRAVLLELLYRIEKAKHPDKSAILPPLLAYALLLQPRKQYALAVDVLETVIGYSSPGADRTRLNATIQLGRCYRMLGDWDASAQSFAEAGQIAASLDDRGAMLGVRIADAELAAERGNIAQAELLLDDVIVQTNGVEELENVRKTGLQARSAVSLLRGELDKSV